MAIATSIPQPSQMIVTLEPGTMVSDIKKAREESVRGETIVCNTPEEMQRYFDSL